MADELTSRILAILSHMQRPIISGDEYPTIPSTAFKSALDRLASREMVVYKTIEREEAILTAEAEAIVAEGSHEAKVYEAVRKSIEGLKIADLPVRWHSCTPVRLDDSFLQES
jgi:phenylalanyl-tRNA synthetase alpha chain